MKTADETKNTKKDSDETLTVYSSVHSTPQTTKLYVYIHLILFNFFTISFFFQFFFFFLNFSSFFLVTSVCTLYTLVPPRVSARWSFAIYGATPREAACSLNGTKSTREVKQKNGE